MTGFAALSLAALAGAACAANPPPEALVASAQTALPLNHPSRDQEQRRLRELSPLPDRGPDVNPWGITGPYYGGGSDWVEPVAETSTAAQRAILARHSGVKAQPIQVSAPGWVTGFNPFSGNR